LDSQVTNQAVPEGCARTNSPNGGGS